MPLIVTNVMVLIAMMLIMPAQKIVRKDLIHVSKQLLVSSKRLVSIMKTVLLMFFSNRFSWG